MSEQACAELSYYIGDGTDPLYMHLRLELADPNPVRDVAGNELGAIAEHWVLDGDSPYTLVPGNRPELDSDHAMACPEPGA